MNIEIGIGIGGSTLFAPTSNDQLVAYAWASAVSPSVSTSSVVHKTVNAVPTNSNTSALPPTVSSAGNATILSVIANANGDALIPNVAIAGSISIGAVVASSNVDSILPVVSTIRNVSVGGVVADSTALAGMPTVTIGGTTTYYLQMDGVDDYIATPSVTFDKVVMDITVDGTSANSFLYLVDARGGTNTDATAINNPFSYVDKSNMTLSRGAGVLTMSVDSVSVSSKVLVSNQRYLIEYTFKNKTDPALELFTNYTRQVTATTKGKIYDIKIYDGVTVTAHYDMSTGTVLDQSGNGRHATLNGGTWVVA